MTNLHTFESRLKAIEQLVNKLSRTKLNEQEVAELVEHARELYDRSVILQYKAYEEKVFGIVTEKVELPVDNIVEPVKLEEEDVQEEEVLIELKEDQLLEEESISVMEPEPAAFDFSLFDEPVDDTESQDLVESPSDRVVEEHVSVTHSESHVGEVREENVVVVKETVSVSNDAVSALANHFAREMAQVESGYNAPRLETLIGSFGLNERLQYINELFHGSSEEFADAVKELDSLSNLDEARHKVAFMAIRNEWDKDSETVADFLNKMKRRYA